MSAGRGKRLRSGGWGVEIPRQRVGGFLTEEIRGRSGRRLGFRGATFDGRETTIAHVDFAGPHRVAKYGVDVAALDRLAEWALSRIDRQRVFLIDEIGQMECCSERLVEDLRRLLDSGRLVVATIARRGGGLIAQGKERPDAELPEVTPENRDRLVADVLDWLQRRGVMSDD